jgi:PTS system fructose-specific IIC component
MVGGAVTGALVMALDIQSRAPHGGIFVFFAINNPLGWFIAIAIGAAISAFVLVALKRFVGPRHRAGVAEPDTARSGQPVAVAA